jgi:hypothetical protein
MMFSSVLAAILRGSQELAPQDDVEMASQRDGPPSLVFFKLHCN